MMERVYHAGIGEPLRWVARAVFDPARFLEAYEPTSLKPRGVMLARLIVPLFLLSWLLVALVRVVPLPAHVLVWSDEVHGLPWGQWEVAAIGVTFGLVVGLLFGVIRGVSFGVIVGLAAGIGIAGPDLGACLVIGLGFSLALGVRGGIVARLEMSLVIGLILGVIGGLTAGLPGGLASGLMAGMGSVLGLYWVPSSLLRVKSAVNGEDHAAEDFDQD